MEAISAVLPMLIFVTMAAVVVVLFTGIIGMVRGGDFNRQYGNRLMRLRVILQAVAVILILVFAAFFRH